MFDKDHLKPACLACLLLSWEILCCFSERHLDGCVHSCEIPIKMEGEFAEAQEFASVEFTAALLTKLPL